MIALALAACSDNNPATTDGGDGGGNDVNVPDVKADVVADAPADAPPPDGGVVVSGTIAITDVTLIDPSVAAVGGINGGSISISFENTADGKGGKVLSGTSAINDCVVTEYDPTHLPHGQLDGDAIQIADAPGDAGTTTGLLKTVGPCTYQSTMGGYVCISNNETNLGVTAAGNNTVAPGTVAFVFTKPFTGENLVGSYLVINGFADTKYNSATSAFPIVAQPNDTTLVVVDTAGTADAAEVKTSGISYTLLNGYLPVPAAGAGADFLGTGSVSVTKAANSVWPAISFTVDVPGQGWSLSDPGDPTALPLTGTAAALNFGCGTAAADGGSTCGDPSSAAIKVMIINGRGTKQAVTSLAPFQMPTEKPGTDTWIEFQCAYIGKQTATLTAPAGQAIIDFAPTRVETRIIQAAGTILTSTGGQTTNLLVGHGIVGHTTHP